MKNNTEMEYETPTLLPANYRYLIAKGSSTTDLGEAGVDDGGDIGITTNP